jgi:hypothetical protein
VHIKLCTLAHIADSKIANDRVTELPVVVPELVRLAAPGRVRKFAGEGDLLWVRFRWTSEFVKVYSMPAIGRRNVHASAYVGRRRISPMEETAQCPNAAGGFAAMAIDRPGWSVVPDAARLVGVPDRR